MTLILCDRSEKTTTVISDSWAFSNSVWEEKDKVFYNKHFVLCISGTITYWILLYEFIEKNKLFNFKCHTDVLEIYSKFYKDMEEKKFWNEDDKPSFTCVLFNKYKLFRLSSSWALEEELKTAIWQYSTEDYISSPLTWSEFILHYKKYNVHIQWKIRKYIFYHNKLFQPKIEVIS